MKKSSIYFKRFSSRFSFSSFDFEGLVPVKVKNNLIYRVQVLKSTNLRVQIRFGFKNLKPSIPLMFWHTVAGAFFSKMLIVLRLNVGLF